MKYLLYHDLKSFLKSYVQTREDGGWNEVLDPNFATLFDTKAMAVKWSRDNTTIGEYAKGISVKEAIKEWKELGGSGFVRRTFEPLSSLSRPYNNESREQVLDWWIKVRGGDEDRDVKYEHYKTWPNLYDLFECLHDMGYYKERYGKNKKEGLSCLVSVKPSCKFSVFRDELNLVLPHTTFFKENDFDDNNDTEYKYVDIFDYRLSENGKHSYLLYSSDEDCVVCGKYKEEAKGSLKDCFEYIRKERYYN